MNASDTIHLHEQLVSEWDAIDAQLDGLGDLRTWPGQLDPAEFERQLLNRMQQIELELESLFYEIIGGELPAGRMP